MSKFIPRTFLNEWYFRQISAKRNLTRILSVSKTQYFSKPFSPRIEQYARPVLTQSDRDEFAAMFKRNISQYNDSNDRFIVYQINLDANKHPLQDMFNIVKTFVPLIDPTVNCTFKNQTLVDQELLQQTKQFRVPYWLRKDNNKQDRNPQIRIDSEIDDDKKYAIRSKRSLQEMQVENNNNNKNNDVIEPPVKRQKLLKSIVATTDTTTTVKMEINVSNNNHREQLLVDTKGIVKFHSNWSDFKEDLSDDSVGTCHKIFLVPIKHTNDAKEMFLYKECERNVAAAKADLFWVVLQRLSFSYVFCLSLRYNALVFS